MIPLPLHWKTRYCASILEIPFHGFDSSLCLTLSLLKNSSLRLKATIRPAMEGLTTLLWPLGVSLEPLEKEDNTPKKGYQKR